MKHIAFIFGLSLIFLSLRVISAPLTGTKTIGGNKPDYLTFSAAISALNTEGVGQGGVTFLVTPGVYNEMLVIQSVAGAGPVSRIVFQANGGPVTIQATGTAGVNAAVRLMGADYITFDGIHVANGGTSAADHCEVGFNLATNGTDDGASYNVIRNCTINMTGGGERPLLSRGISSSFTSINTSSGNSGFNTFHDISVDGAEIGIYLLGAYFMEAEGNEIRNCTFGSTVPIGNDASGTAGIGYAILASDQKYCSISGNIIDSVRVTNPAASGQAVGIYLFRSTGVVYSNRVNHVYQGGLSTTAASIGIQGGANFSGSLKIFNNMIRGISSGYTGAGSNIVSVNGLLSINSTTAIQAPVEWYYNTVELNADGPVNYSSAAMCISTSNFNHQATVKNNILINNINAGTTTNWSFAITDFNTSILKLTSNFNDLYVSGTNSYVGYSKFNTTYSATLTNWQTNTGKDLQSVSALPVFISPTDLHLETLANPVLSNAGTPVPGIIGDFDLTVRNTVNPEIGADEICTTAALVPEVSIASGIPPVINEGDPIEFTATVVNGGPAPVFEWLVNGLPAGVSSATFNTSTLQNGDQVSCRVFSSLPCGSALPVMSDTITVTVYSIIPEVTILEFFYFEWGTVNCFHALDTIVTATNSGDFYVQDGASVSLIAGERILMMPGTTVEPGGYLHARIAPEGPYCNNAIVAPPLSRKVLAIASGNAVPEFRIFPNPTDGLFTVDIPEDFVPYQNDITVLNIQGQEIVRETVSGVRSRQFSITNQPRGLYFLQIKTGKTVQSVKIIRN